MGGISENAIRERAYLIWEREGRPDGRDFDHWLQARIELLSEGSPGEVSASAAVPVPRARSNEKKSPAAKPRRSGAGRGKRSA